MREKNREAIKFESGARGRFECPRSEAESRREDAGTVPVAYEGGMGYEEYE